MLGAVGIVGARGGGAALLEWLRFFQAQRDVCEFEQTRAGWRTGAIIPGAIPVIAFQIRFGCDPQIFGSHICCRFVGALTIAVLFVKGQATHSQQTCRIADLVRIAAYSNPGFYVGGEQIITLIKAKNPEKIAFKLPKLLPKSRETKESVKKPESVI